MARFWSPARARKPAQAKTSLLRVQSQWHAGHQFRHRRQSHNRLWRQQRRGQCHDDPPDGKIVLAGYSQDSSGNDSFALARYNVNGSLDTSLESGGLVTRSFGDGHKPSDRRSHQRGWRNHRLRLVVSQLLSGQTDTHSHFALLRLNSNGTPDSSFSTATYGSRAVTTGFQRLGFFDGIRHRPHRGRHGPPHCLAWHRGPGQPTATFAIACYDPSQAAPARLTVLDYCWVRSAGAVHVDAETKRLSRGTSVHRIGDVFRHDNSGHLYLFHRLGRWLHRAPSRLQTVANISYGSGAVLTMGPFQRLLRLHFTQASIT